LIFKGRENPTITLPFMVGSIFITPLTLKILPATEYFVKNNCAVVFFNFLID